MMFALITFVRELGIELVRRADTIDAESKEELSHDVMLVVVATASSLRQISAALAVAAKKTFLA